MSVLKLSSLFEDVLWGVVEPLSGERVAAGALGGEGSRVVEPGGGSSGLPEWLCAELGGASSVSEQELYAALLRLVTEVVVSCVGRDVGPDDALMDAGLDSLSAVEFRNELSERLEGVALPSTLVFDYPSVASISKYLVGGLAQRVWGGA